ncbi:hypothetical protein [Dapis sp. BLCC M229]|uniref:hypothetical protein n=1 Tax=Dapis sp. BLCC M229 TaxID=3400188 RepID=UPI003CE99067
MLKSLRIWKFLGVILLRNVYVISLIGITTPHHLLAQTTTGNYAAVSEDNIINNDSKNKNASVYLNWGVEKYNQRDFSGVFSDFSKALVKLLN